MPSSNSTRIQNNLTRKARTSSPSTAGNNNTRTLKRSNNHARTSSSSSSSVSVSTAASRRGPPKLKPRNDDKRRSRSVFSSSSSSASAAASRAAIARTTTPPPPPAPAPSSGNGGASPRASASAAAARRREVEMSCTNISVHAPDDCSVGTCSNATSTTTPGFLASDGMPLPLMQFLRPLRRRVNACRNAVLHVDHSTEGRSKRTRAVVFLMVVVVMSLSFSNGVVDTDDEVQTIRGPREAVEKGVTLKDFRHGQSGEPPAFNHAQTLPQDESSAQVPQALRHLANVTTPFDSDVEVPYFWHVALSGGTAMEKILGSCHHLVLAADVEGPEGEDQALHVLRRHGNMYINLDLTTPTGIQKAITTNLLSSNLAEVILTTTLYETSAIFTSQHQGRLFALLHHPIERAVSLFYYLQRAPHDPGYRRGMENMTVVEYARSKYAEDNWLVRFLADQRAGVVTHDHLQIAKTVLSEKCLVGLLSEFSQAVERFERYFGWTAAAESEKAKACRDKWVQGRDRRHYHPSFGEGSEVWELLLEHNRLDLELYEYAKVLFQEQGRMLGIGGGVGGGGGAGGGAVGVASGVVGGGAPVNSEMAAR